MKRLQSLGIFMLILGTILFPSVSINNSVSSAPNTLLTALNKERFFLLANGVVTYKNLDFWRTEAAGDEFGIEWAMNVSIVETVNLTSLSSSVVNLEKTFQIIPNSAYQQRGGIRYNPSFYGLRFFNDDLDLLATDNSSKLSFSATRNVNKSSGERILAQNPFGATLVTVVAYYDSSDPDAYSWTMYLAVIFGGVGSFTNIFHANASIWEIGETIDDIFTVSGTGSLQNYETWILERNENPEGLSDFLHEFEFEKTSGLFVKEDFRGALPNSFYSEYHRWLDDLGGVIDDGYPEVSAPPGRIVNSQDPVTISFNASDVHFDHYNLYRGGSLFETNTSSKPEWDFTVQPSSENITWTLELVDELGLSRNATTWIMYISKGIPGWTFPILILSILWSIISRRLKTEKVVKV